MTLNCIAPVSDQLTIKIDVKESIAGDGRIDFSSTMLVINTNLEHIKAICYFR